MQRAIEALGEVELIGIAEGLVAKDQHRVLIHAGPNMLKGVAIMHGAQIDRAGFGDKACAKAGKGQAHGQALW